MGESSMGLDQITANEFDPAVQVATLADYMSNEFAQSTISDRLATLDLVAVENALSRVKHLLDREGFDEKITHTRP